jgi:hypothetical protein
MAVLRENGPDWLAEEIGFELVVPFWACGKVLLNRLGGDIIRWGKERTADWKEKPQGFWRLLYLLPGMSLLMASRA